MLLHYQNLCLRFFSYLSFMHNEKTWKKNFSKFFCFIKTFFISFVHKRLRIQRFLSSPISTSIKATLMVSLRKSSRLDCLISASKSFWRQLALDYDCSFIQLQSLFLLSSRLLSSCSALWVITVKKKKIALFFKLAITIEKN